MPDYKEYDIRDIMSLVGAQPYKKSKANSSGWISMKCPRIGKEYRVNVANNSFSCFHGCMDCPLHTGHGKFELYSLYTGEDCSDTKAIAKKITKALNSNQSFSTGEMQKQKEEIVTVNNDPRGPELSVDRFYRTFLSMLTLREEHKKNLTERGMTEEDIVKGGYRSIPTAEEQKTLILKLKKDRNIIFKGVPGLFQENGKWYFNIPSEKGFFIPYYNGKGSIVGLQMRFDNEYLAAKYKDVKERKNGRYRPLSSSNREGGVGFRNEMHYGIPGTMKANGSSYVVYATEGALKANTACSLAGNKKPFVAIVGVTCFAAWREGLQFLKKLGVQRIVDAFDSDRASNKNVADAIKTLYQIAHEEGFEMVRFDWGTEQKGVDDYLLACKTNKGQQKKISVPKFIAPPIPTARIR